MKVRIIELQKGSKIWYIVQYKKLLFWDTVKNEYGYDARYTDFKYAKEAADFYIKEAEEPKKTCVWKQ